MGAWFLTNAGGSKLAGSLAAFSGRVPLKAVFFMIPCVASIVAAGLLYLCIPWLNRLTRGAAA